MRGIKSGVIFPSWLATISSSAPKARIVSSFSRAKASDETTLNGYPFTAQTKARDEPVLPPVYSTTVMPGRKSPRFSASSIIARAIRSLYEPVGLKYSNFMSTSALLRRNNFLQLYNWGVANGMDDRRTQLAYSICHFSSPFHWYVLEGQLLQKLTFQYTLTDRFAFGEGQNIAR